MRITESMDLYEVMTIYFHFVLEIKLKIRLIILNGSFFPSVPIHSFTVEQMFSLIKGLCQNKIHFLHICFTCDAEISLVSVYWYFSWFRDTRTQNSRKGHLAEILLAESNVMNKPVLETMKCYHP